MYHHTRLGFFASSLWVFAVAVFLRHPSELIQKVQVVKLLQS